MSIDQKYSCSSELGAEILMVVTSVIIAICVLTLVQLIDPQVKHKAIVEPGVSLLLSLAYALFLPLMSYLFSQAKQFREGRAQVVLTWMVFIEMIHLHGDPKFSWGLRKSAEQLVRTFWIIFLIYSYTSLNGIRVSLFILCVYLAISEIFKGIYFNKVQNSYLIGENPELIHNYVKKKMVQNDFHTTPMNNCDYIVMGEENHEVDIDDNGYLLGKKKSESVGMLTIGRVFQLNSSEDEAFTSAHPYWRDTCLSLALAKMLRRRFAKLPIAEAGSQNALDFVLEWLNVYMDGSIGERSPTKRVFNIIENELKMVSELSHSRKPISHYYIDCYRFVDINGLFIFFGSGIYLIHIIIKRSSEWMSQLVVEDDAYNNCFFHTLRGVAVVMKTFSRLDQAITILLFIACVYIQIVQSGMAEDSMWDILDSVQTYIKDPTEWYERHRWYKRHFHKNRSNKQSSISSKQVQRENVKQERVHFSVFELKAKSFIWYLPKWTRRKLAWATPTGSQSTEAKETILRYLRKSKGQLSNGNTSLRGDKMERLNWASRSNWSNTEAILIWHIATTLFHYLETTSRKSSVSHQEPSPQQNEKCEVALELSSYCHKLVQCRPEFLPDAAKWTEKTYANVRNEILKIDGSSGQKPTKACRCDYALEKPMDENSIIGKGTKLAKDMVSCAENGANMWPKLADFWAEMLLFVAPSDNLEGHEEMLERGELITQLWALLTHAGILERPKPTERQYRKSNEDNEIAREMIV